MNLPLLMGAPVTLDVTPQGSRLHFDVEGPTQIIRTDEALAEIQNL